MCLLSACEMCPGCVYRCGTGVHGWSNGFSPFVLGLSSKLLVKTHNNYCTRRRPPQLAYAGLIPSHSGQAIACNTWKHMRLSVTHPELISLRSSCCIIWRLQGYFHPWCPLWF